MRLSKIKLFSILIIIMFFGVCIIPIISGNVNKLNTFSDVKIEFEDEASKRTYDADINLHYFSNKESKEVLVVDHSSVSESNQIPEYWIDQAKSNLHIAYQHTSHGSQLVTGMNALENFPSFGDKYEWTDDGSSGLDFDDYGIPGCADLSQGDWIDGYGVTPWVTSTRNLLNDPSNTHINVIMWSWCSINGHNISRYLENMDILVGEYPNVDFVFMTGHAEGQGEGGFIHTANEQIRQHCIDNDRILFDFSDIENYDPDEIYYYDKPMWDDLDYNPDHTNNWGEEWIDDNTGSELEQLTTGNDVIDYEGCESCAHSDGPSNKARINCVLKGQGVWYLMAKLAEFKAPLMPTRPQGPLNGRIDVEYEYITSVIDPNEDEVYLMWDWGDNSDTEWIGPYDSGKEITTSHNWKESGDFKIKVKAKDIWDYESDWSDPLSVSMPKTRQYINTPFLQFLENHPHLFPLLQRSN